MSLATFRQHRVHSVETRRDTKKRQPWHFLVFRTLSGHVFVSLATFQQHRVHSWKLEETLTKRQTWHFLVSRTLSGHFFVVSLATFRQHRVQSVELEEMFRNGRIPDTIWTYFRVSGLNLSPCRDTRSLSGATDPNFARSVRSIRWIFVAEKCPEQPKSTKKW